MRGNLADLAATGLASEPTLRKWIQAQPAQAWIIKRGSNGDAYEIDIPGAIAAWKEEQDQRTKEAERRAEDLRQLGFDLLGDSIVSEGPAFSVADRKQLMEEELIAIRLAEKRRTLIPVASVEAVVGDLLARDAQRWSTFTARLAKKMDFSRDQLAAIDRQLDNDRGVFADEMENWGKDLDIGDGSETSSAALDDPAVSDGR